MGRKYVVFGIVAVIFTALDQVTKVLVRLHIPEGQREIKLVDGFFSLVHAENRGAAFGMGNSLDLGPRLALFGVFTVVALGVLLHMLWQLHKDDAWQATAIGLITSGALGNAIDRVHKAQVTDFLRVYTSDPGAVAWMADKPFISGFCGRASCDWPSFNVADAAIVVGLGVFLLHYAILQRESAELEPKPPHNALDDAPSAQGPAPGQ